MYHCHDNAAPEQADQAVVHCQVIIKAGTRESNTHANGSTNEADRQHISVLSQAQEYHEHRKKHCTQKRQGIAQH